MTAEEIKRDHPIEDFLIRKGIKLVGGGANKITNRCAQSEHKPSHLCVSVNVDKGLWHCNDCGLGGDVIRWMAIEEGMDDGEILKLLGGKQNGQQTQARPQARPDASPGSHKIAATYDYKSETGELLYQVVRMDPKDFRQRHKLPDGKWVWNMEGVKRVLFNLPLVLNPKNRYVWICEGEKDCLTLEGLGLCATTNVGGAKKWMAAYSECLIGKEVILCGDNDDAGRAHMKQVLESLVDKANSIRQVTVPPPSKDISDFVKTFPKIDDAQIAVGKLVESAPILTGGMELPIQSMEELEAEYIEHLRLSSNRVLNLSNWLPSLGRKCRGLHPGEMVSILAATGVGKTAMLQNLAKSAAPLPTLLFELELPGSLTFERFCAMSEGVSCLQVETEYTHNTKNLDWRKNNNLQHIYTCTRSRITPSQLEVLINKAELKMGVRPVLVCLDYVQLMGSDGRGDKRYEVVSDAAEALKRIAKSTKTIIVIASQIKRKNENDKKTQAVSLYDGKESGGIENSSGLVLGAWRPSLDRIHIRILKNTKGFAEKEEDATICSFEGASMTIRELIEKKIDDADVPSRDWKASAKISPEDADYRNPHPD